MVFITTLASSFIGLAYEDISSFLHNRRHKVLPKSVKVLDNKTTIQHNKLIHLENSMIMCGINGINTVLCIHNTTASNEKLFTGQQSSLTTRSLYSINTSAIFENYPG